ncbi:hypothetical protein D8674_039646 [Pyrus ussuriensis x Pyrus communis]|uniref:CCHC-type domain-containing protein n=1 Tax=Pyrus ussuriensis x Pyrus communis TaxID=2448454 RepID=A0A5N5H4G3_9ROSA|nr:hypothetical protein D8674_039646 [Pyrus ussuriensis x Pyrus communis]
MGFSQSSSDASLFVLHAPTLVIVLVYVDDILVSGPDAHICNQFIAQLSTLFPVKDLGPLHYFLGLEVHHTKAGMLLHQNKYLLDLLQKTHMTGAKPCSTPLSSTKLDHSGDLLADPTEYRSLVGALQYLTWTRPDISFALVLANLVEVKYVCSQDQIADIHTKGATPIPSRRPFLAVSPFPFSLGSCRISFPFPFPCWILILITQIESENLRLLKSKSNMARSGNVELSAPVFNGENYEFWSIRMKTILKSHGLWELVANWFESSDPKSKEATVDETKKETSGEMSFSEILMKDARVQEVVASLKGFEQRLDLHAESSTEKAFASLTVATKGARSGGFFGNHRSQENWKSRGKGWDHKSNFVQRQSNIQRGWDHKPNYAQRQNNTQRNWDHRPNYTQKQNNSQGDCKWCDRLHYGKCWYEGKPKCTSCGKPGHSVKDCHENKGMQKANYARQMGEMGSLFYACNAVTDVKVNNSWYIDSGCSNHMIGDERLLVDVQRNLTSKVKMGTGEVVQVAGKGTLVIETKLGRKHIQEVMLVPGLEENLLSVGQMMEHGYYLLFGGDVVNVFDGVCILNGVLKEEMYVEEPQGFVKESEETKVYKLNKALYGLKQAPRAWYDEINAYFNSAGFEKSSSEATLYVKTRKDSGIIIVSLYVDDIVYTGSSPQMLEEFRNDMMKHYEMTDLASLLSRFMHNPTKKHMGTAKRVLRYIQGTFDFGIIFDRGKATTLIGYCDSDWAGSEDDMRSTSGYAFTLGSAIAMAKNPVFHQKTRHINRKFHFIREVIQAKEIELMYCKTEEQIPDILTKALPKDRFVYLRELLGVKLAKGLGGSVGM